MQIPIIDLDVKDKRILYELDLNARIGTTELAKKVGLSQEAVHYRIKQLEAKGIIHGYMAFINFAKLGYTNYVTYAKLQGTRSEQEKIIAQLEKFPHVCWMAEFCGRFDIAITLVEKNIIDFNEAANKLTTLTQGALKDPAIETVVQLLQYPRTYLLDKTTPKSSPSFGISKEIITIDELDDQLLRAISNNARASVLELARELKQPASTVRLRLKLLEKNRIIEGYGAQIVCEKLGYQTHKLILFTQNMTPEKKSKLYTYSQQHKNVIWIIEVVCQWNFELTCEFENTEQLRQTIIDLRTEFADCISDIETITVFNTYLKYNLYPINAATKKK